MTYIVLALGGAFGTLARHGLGTWITTWAGTGFPWGTLTVNILGSFILGFAIRSAELLPVSPQLLGAITIGFCGAFTTFSTFSFETLGLLQEGVWLRATLYAMGSLALGLVALALGLAGANLVVHRAMG